MEKKTKKLILEILEFWPLTIVIPLMLIGIVLGAPATDRYLALSVMLAIFYINTASWMYLAAILEKRAAHNHLSKRIFLSDCLSNIGLFTL